MFIIYQIVIRINSSFISNVLAFFGRYSLEIYLCQCLCLNIGVGTGTIRIITILISATIISILLSIITNHIYPLKLILYGKLKKE